MKLIVGLGNPGLRYRNTRHNAGFKVLAELASRHGLKIKKKGFGGVYASGRVMSHPVVLFEPLTYMNLSGEAVESACSRWLEDKADLLVVSDDVNLGLGSVRLREKGSAGGHNGLRSIIEFRGTDFARLRVGVKGGEIKGDMADYVLSSFPRKERALLNEGIDKAVECIETWLEKGIKKAMGLYNIKEA